MTSRALTRVRNKETNKEGTVIDILSAQITVEYDDGTFGFLMFKYRGAEWEPIYKENNK
jgi:hypothetical protein